MQCRGGGIDAYGDGDVDRADLLDTEKPAGPGAAGEADAAGLGCAQAIDADNWALIAARA